MAKCNDCGKDDFEDIDEVLHHTCGPGDISQGSAGGGDDEQCPRCGSPAYSHGGVLVCSSCGWDSSPIEGPQFDSFGDADE